MNINDIKAFVAVAETGSINRAAILLRLTQPAMTRRVQNLETALGATLLDRQSRPPTLTPAGRIALEHCRAVLKSVDALRGSLSDGSEPAGEFRIGIAHGVADVMLSRPIDELRQRFPKVRLKVSSGWTLSLLDAVQSHAFDAIVALIPRDRPVPPGLIARAVGAEEVRIVAPRELHILSPVAIGGLADFPWVLNPDGCGYRAALQRAFQDRSLPLSVAAEVIGKELQLSLVARGVGLGLVPRRLIRRSPLSGRLDILNVPDFDLQASISVVRPSLLGRLEPLADSLEQAFRHAFQEEISETLA